MNPRDRDRALDMLESAAMFGDRGGPWKQPGYAFERWFPEGSERREFIRQLRSNDLRNARPPEWLTRRK